MYDNIIINIVGLISTALTIGLFSSGWFFIKVICRFVCRKFIEIKSSDLINPFPFIFGFLCAIINFYYGYSLNDFSIMITNFLGIIFQTYFSYLYVKFSSHKNYYLKLFAFIILNILIMVIYIEHKKQTDFKSSLTYLGFMACTAALTFFASPLTSLVSVIKKRNTQCLSFHFSCLAFAVSTCWTIYGKLKHDPFIMIPNFLGILISLIQLYLFYLYSDYPKNTDELLI